MQCEPGAGGLLCPQCFVIRAHAAGIAQYVWAIVPVPPSMDPEVPLRGRVTPKYHRFEGPPTELLRQWYVHFCLGDWERCPPFVGKSL
jgi:hypothetical protein